jgi:DNA repair protein RecN (Recombination protein N)
MLRELRVRNLAVIEEARVIFAPGLNVLTGETGAGKSILIDALLLVTGARGSPDLIRSGAGSAVVEGVFDADPGDAVAGVLDEAGHALADGQLVIKRELPRSGRGRVFVNDSAATVGLLERLGDLLVEVHGQHEHQRLLEPARQLDLLDRFAGCTAARENVGALVRACEGLRGEIGRARQDAEEGAGREDLYRSQLSEIDATAPTEGEDEALVAERRRLRNAERLAAGLGEAAALLYDDAQAALFRLNRAGALLRGLAQFDPDVAAPTEILDAAHAHVEEAASRIRLLRARACIDPERLEAVEARLDALAKLRRKYGGTDAAVLASRAQIAHALDRIEHHHEVLEGLEARLQAAAADAAREALALSGARAAAAPTLARRVQRDMRRLGMAQARVQVGLRRERATAGELACGPDGWRIGPRGLDAVELLVSMNPGEEPKPLAKVISGGELSRTMLAVKSVLAEADETPTMVFDEVDAGIGGRVADVVGQKLREAATRRQVLCVTHLAPIAAHADHHLLVEKRTGRDATRTTVRALEDAGRVEELARMLAGERMTETTRRHARELYGAVRRAR